MSDLPFALVANAIEPGLESKSSASVRIETAAMILFAATAVLFVSFIAVMTGLV
jgi:hypothetical protein